MERRWKGKNNPEGFGEEKWNTFFIMQGLFGHVKKVEFYSKYNEKPMKAF